MREALGFSVARVLPTGSRRGWEKPRAEDATGLVGMGRAAGPGVVRSMALNEAFGFLVARVLPTGRRVYSNEIATMFVGGDTRAS